MIEVDFDFFNPTEIDFHSIKLLLTQLLSHDSINLDLGSISDLIISQSNIGSVVKTDGEESDPFAILSVLNLNLHKVSQQD